MIEVIWDGENTNEVWIPFYLWEVVVAVKEDTTKEVGEPDIFIYNKKTGEDVTEDYVTFQNKDNKTIRPTGINLYNILDILRSNLKEKGQ